MPAGPPSSPSQTPHSVHVRVDRQSTWHHDPSNRIASFEISVGNPRCNGRYLEAQLRWAQSRFVGFEFSVGDLLNVHTYRTIGHPRLGVLSAIEAEAVAIAEGDTWIERNRNLISSVLPQEASAIVRWATWLEIADVQQHLTNLTSLFNTDDSIQSLVMAESRAYARRREALIEDLDRSSLALLNRYVLEELAIYQYQAERTRAVHVYPGHDALLRGLAGVERLPESLRTIDYALLHLSVSADGPSRV